MTVRLTPSEAKKIGIEAKGKPSKYRNKRVTIDGETFDSQLEAKHWHQLKLLERAGQIYGLERQRPFALIAPDGSLITTYRCDFAYFDGREDRFRVIDVKGVITDVFRIKRKLMKAFLGIDVEIVRKGEI